MTLTLNELCDILDKTLQLNDIKLDENTELLNNLPEFDSLTILKLLTQLEKRCAIQIDDDDITRGIFNTVGTLWQFLKNKTSQNPR